MKATGIVRRIDDLGRVVIPKEIRHRLNLREDDALEFFIEDGGLYLKRYDYISNVFDAVELVKNQVSNFCDLKKKEEFLQKVSELEAMMQAERDDFSRVQPPPCT